MNVTILGAHNCESQDTRFVSLLIDDSIALDAGGLTSGLSFPAQLKLRTILLTHQHYDHIRDIPAVAMNFSLAQANINVCSILPVYNILTNHLFGSEIYPNFLERPQENPIVEFFMIEEEKVTQIDNYNVLAVTMNHSVPTVGYQITSSDGKAVFYTGDTGPGLSDCWQGISPRLLITEVTAPDKYEDFARKSGHLTPGLLKQELVTFRELKGYLPQVVTVHMNPDLEDEITTELATVSEELGSPITQGYEGMQLYL